MAGWFSSATFSTACGHGRAVRTRLALWQDTGQAKRGKSIAELNRWHLRYLARGTTIVNIDDGRRRRLWRRRMLWFIGIIIPINVNNVAISSRHQFFIMDKL